MGSSKPAVLFVTYGGGHAAMVVPVAQRLMEQNLADPTIVALTIAAGPCRRAGVPVLTAKDLLPIDEDERAHVLATGERLVADLEPHPDIEPIDSIAYHGLSFTDLERTRGEARAREMFEADGRRAFLPVALFERLIRERQPDVVVATNAPRAERAAILAAKKLGVPACCIVNLIAPRAYWLSEPNFADRVCVLSDGVRDALVAKGRDPADVVVTGNPEFDALAAVRARRRPDPDGRFRVLWAANPEPDVHPIDGRRGIPDLNARIAEALRACCERHPEWTVIVRPHPSETSFSASGPPNLRVVRQEALHDRLAQTDVAVGTVSTAVIQASLAGIPTVAISGSVFERELPLADYGLAHAATVDDIDHVLQRLRDVPDPLDSGFASIGTATQRVVDVVLELAGESAAPQ